MGGPGDVEPYDLGPTGLADLLAGEPDYRRRQVEAWLTRGVDDPGQMTDLPMGLRERLAGAFGTLPAIVRHSTADDGRTHKVLLRYGDGEAIESVLMLYPRAEATSGRATVCISTQAGCAMACPFCATGQAGFRRQLTFGETVRQVTIMQRLLTTGAIRVPGTPDHVTNVVFMGMGEPLANLDVTVRAVRWLAGRAGWSSGFGLSARSITVSTVGLVPGIRRLIELGLPITLAVSLHAPNDALRDDLVPVNRRHPIASLLAACRDYRTATGRRLTFEYVLIDGVNTELEHARELAQLVGRTSGSSSAGHSAHVNLIPMNPTPAVPWRAPAVAQQRAFRDVLTRAGVVATIRANRGGDIDAACGQLYADYAVASGRMLPSAKDAWRRWPVQSAAGASA
ncbi:MAG: 23S rRNA (adenine(2503)-C(2))-methyltransferase RlmN [Egibacteraceae bacterium]